MTRTAKKAPAYFAIDKAVLDAVRTLSGADEGGDEEGFAKLSHIVGSVSFTVAEIKTSLDRLVKTNQLTHSVYGYSVVSRRSHG